MVGLTGASTIWRRFASVLAVALAAALMMVAMAGPAAAEGKKTGQTELQNNPGKLFNNFHGDPKNDFHGGGKAKGDPYN